MFRIRQLRLAARIAACGIAALLAFLASNSATTAVRTNASTASAAQPRMIALPRLEVTFDGEGVPSVFGVSARLLEQLTFGAFPARWVQLDRGWVDYFMSTNVQHIELLQNDEGVFAWINGRRLPNVAWNAHELSNSAQLAERLGVLEALGLSNNVASFVNRTAPSLRRFAIDLMLHFPRRAGVAAIPSRDAGQAVHSLPRQPIKDAQHKLDVTVRYDAHGDPWPEGQTDEEFRSRTGFDVMNMALEPAVVESLTSRGLRSLTVRSQADGLMVLVNGVSLPALQCDARCLVDLGDIIATLNTYPQTEHLNAPIRALAPTLHTIDANIALQFPAPASADAVATTSR